MATTPRPVYQSVSVSRAIDTFSTMRCIPTTCICCGECLKCHPKMQGGLNCRPEIQRTCPKLEPKSEKTTYRKLSQRHESSPSILAMKQARYHPYQSQSGPIRNTNTTTALRYDSCPPCPTQQPYPFEPSVYPQHTTVPAPQQDECADILHPHQPNVNTSQANLNTGHILQDPPHPSNTFPNPATQGLHTCPTPGVYLSTTPQGD